MRPPHGRRCVGAALLVVASTTVPAGVGAQSPAPPVPVLRIPFPRDDGTLTPYTFELSYPLLTLVYDTLMWRDAQGVPQPWLARSVDPTTDGTRLMVHLANGARWHDGPPVTSADVAFTFDYVAKHRHPRFTPEITVVDHVETPDPLTAIIVLRHPSPGFLDQPLADLPIIPAHLWKGLRRDQLAPDGLPVGSGPYRLVEHQAGLSYRLQANADYFRGPPAARTIEVPFIGSAEAMLQALERRTVDAIPVSLSAALTERVKAEGLTVKTGPSFLGTVLLFNLRQAPFDRLDARQAVAAAVDVERISNLVGDTVPATRGYLHPDSAWAPPDPLPQPSSPPGAAVGGLAAGAPLEVLAPDNDAVASEAARQVAMGLDRSGIRAAAKLIPAAEMGKALGEDGSTPSFTLAISSSPALPSYDPDYLLHVFGSDPRSAPLNYSGYKSARFDQLAERTASTADARARRAIVAETLQLLATDLPVVPLFFSKGAYAYRPAIFDGWVLVKGGGILDKGSFVGPRPPSQAAPTSGAIKTTPSPPSGPATFMLIALALGGAALLVGLLALFSRLR